MKYEINDQEAIFLVRDNNPDAKDKLYEKYKYIIDIHLKKYQRMAYLLKIDSNDLYQEAMLGFTDAINNYQDDKDASLPTFITLCVNRKLQNVIRKANSQKNRITLETISLDQSINPKSNPLIDAIGDNKENPLEKLTNQEEYNELVKNIENILSANEYEVYTLMITGLNYQDIAIILNKSPKQIDNTIQRIRLKIKKMLAK